MTQQDASKMLQVTLHVLAGVTLAIVGYWCARLEGKVDVLESARLERARASATQEVELRHVSSRMLEVRDEVRELSSKFSQIKASLLTLEANGEQR